MTLIKGPLDEQEDKGGQVGLAVQGAIETLRI